MFNSTVTKLRLNEELSYIAGALRDSSIIIRDKHDYEFRIAQKSREWLELLNAILKKNFGRKGSIYSEKRRNASGIIRTYYVLRIFDKKLVTLLLNLFNIRIPQVEWETPAIIKNASLNLVKYYIRGFFDAEGGLPKDPSKFYYISFDQANLESITFIRSKLQQMGYNPTNVTRTGGVWQFRLTRRDDIIRFKNDIGSWHPEKSRRLNLLCDLIENSSIT